MEKKYYLKLVKEGEGIQYLTDIKDDKYVFDYVNTIKDAKILEESQMESFSILLSLLKEGSLELEEAISDKYNIVNFDPDRNGYTYLTTNYIFQERMESYSSFNIEETENIWKSIRNNYQYPDNIRIIIEVDNKKYDYETGIKFNDINLYLKLDEMISDLLKLTDEYPMMYRSVAKEIQNAIDEIKQQGIGGVDDRNL